MTKEEFIKELSLIGITINDQQLNQFDLYFHTLVEWNEKMNLTSIVMEGDVYLKHFYDSLTIAKDFKFNNQKIIDIGAGAGFPSIPLKIIYPDLDVTIVDSLNKRITFLNHLFDVLKLDNTKAIASRAEEYATDHKEEYDVAMARAVARLNILDELCLPLVKKDGYFLTLKGKAGKIELDEAKKGIKILGGKVEAIKEFKLPGLDDNRINIIIKKEGLSPKKYPRNFAKIKKSPL
ncbi:MAG: 16S rRNA (guanine(527)-N(7))-methyltransferase RsmG [Thomasclavelia sp.]|jgi:16S rRNA (guanine527-N7)-methyltransferase|nr:16S rRNA (guanine(527)-N(7))-methyltransferase RsmG [Thomasclavelia sp.]